MEKEIEKIIFEIIATSGEARSEVFNALKAFERGEHNKVKKSLVRTSELIAEANKALFKLIQKEARGEKIEFSLLLVHACDIFMASILEKELSERFIKLIENIKMQIE